MFIKVTTTAGRRYAQLVESYRNDAGQPRQRTLATLGRLEPGGDVDRLVTALQRAQGREPAASRSLGAAAVDLKFLGAHDAGNLWALWQVWCSLDLEGLALAWRRSKSGIDVLACLRAMVFNRLCDPCSKLGLLRWLQTVALPRGFGFEAAAPEHQHLLRAMDVLDEHTEAINERLSVLMRPLIDQELSVVFYDLTTVRVHGEAQVEGDVREHGRTKEGGVARQFMLSLVQTADGLPIAHQVHPGNTAEAGTLLPMIESLLARWPLKRVVLVADRGLLSLDNLREIEALQQRLREQGREVQLDYVLAVPAARYGEFKAELLELHARHDGAAPWVAEATWRHEVKPTAGTPGPAETARPTEQTYRLVVAHDPETAERRTLARRRQIDELVALGQQWSGRLDEQDSGQRGRGRPLSDSGAKARLYHAVKDAGLAHVIRVDLRGELFSFDIDEQRLKYLECLDGKLLLVTNTGEPGDEVVQRYKSLADIERGFRALKSDIEIGPVFHRLPKRIRAHALVCFLALILHRVMRLRLKAAGRSESPMRLLAQLSRLHLQTVQAPDGQRLSGLTEQTPQQRELFAAIGASAPTAAQMHPPCDLAEETSAPL